MRTEWNFVGSPDQTSLRRRGPKLHGRVRARPCARASEEDFAGLAASGSESEDAQESGSSFSVSCFGWGWRSRRRVLKPLGRRRLRLLAAAAVVPE